MVDGKVHSITLTIRSSSTHGRGVVLLNMYTHYVFKSFIKMESFEIRQRLIKVVPSKMEQAVATLVVPHFSI